MNKLEIRKRKFYLKRQFLNRYKLSNYESYDRDEKIIERALSDVDLSKIGKLRKAKKYSEIVSIYNKRIDILKNLCVDLNYDEIRYKYVGYYSVIFSKPIHKLLVGILDDLVEEDEEVYDMVNRDGYDDPELCIEIDSDNLNRVDIMNGLPNFLLGLGLGKKTYKKLIKDLGYISSLSGGDVNLNSSMVWKSIAKDSELYTFCNDDNIISFWNGVNYDKIVIKLREFYYKKGSNIVFDSDFLNKYKLEREDLMKII